MRNTQRKPSNSAQGLTVDEASIENALNEAEQICQHRGTRLTKLRRRVLEIVLGSETPQGAYAILDILRNDGHLGAPPTVYRSLDFLLEQGLIHRLSSINVFFACKYPSERHSGQFLVCKDCGRVREMHSLALEMTVREKALDHNFQVDNQIIEILGHCEQCTD